MDAPSEPPGRTAANGGDDRSKARAVRGWCFYDCANSAFATTVTAAVLPPYFADVAARVMPGNQATAIWAYASAAALALAALVGPLLGVAADRLGRRKTLLLACVAVGALTTAALALTPPGAWQALLALFGVAFLAFAAGNVLYDSLLPTIAEPHEMHSVSARGFAYGYLGGGVLLALNLAWILAPHSFGLPNADAAVRLSMLSVGLWWLGFSIPLWRSVPEPPPPGPPPPLGRLVGVVISELSGTLASLPRRPELFKFLIAFWLYSDGIGTIIKMATVYGREVGIGRTHLIGALLLVQLLAAPASLAFGRLAGRIGPKAAVILGLMGYVGITMLGFFLSRPWHFWLLAVLVALFQGGTQALSRSMFAMLVPRRKVSEYFGFYSVSEKLAGVAGPVLFGIVAQASAGRFAVLTLLPSFVIGAWLLSRVDLNTGARAADNDTD